MSLAPCHPAIPRPDNAALVFLAQEVVTAIERCGASPELTRAVALASDLKTYLQKPEEASCR